MLHKDLIPLLGDTYGEWGERVISMEVPDCIILEEM